MNMFFTAPLTPSVGQTHCHHPFHWLRVSLLLPILMDRWVKDMRTCLSLPPQWLSGTVSASWAGDTRIDPLFPWFSYTSDLEIHNNNNNNRIQRCNSRFFTISSLCCEPSPTRTLKWPGRKRVQITYNTSSAYHVQHIVLIAMKGQLSY